MPTSLIEAAETWSKDRTLLTEFVLPRPIIFGEILTTDKKKYDSPFPLTIQKKVETAKLEWTKIPEWESPKEKYTYIDSTVEFKTTYTPDPHTFTVAGEMKQNFNTYGCIEIPLRMERDVKNKFGGGKVVTPDPFKKLMKNIGVAIEHVYFGNCHVNYTKPDTVHLFPKKLFSYMLKELGEFNYAYEYILAHEIIHTTGTAKRLKRRTIVASASWSTSASYRTEECIAIIGSAKLLSKLGYEMSSKMLERHENILANWSEGNASRLEEAEKKAEEAVNYLLTGEIKWYKRVLNKLTMA